MADLGAPDSTTPPLHRPPSDPSTRSSGPGRAGRALLALLRLLPKNAISRLAGRFASIHWPGPVQRAEIRLFAWAAGVDLSEARDPIDAFDSLQQFFTRALREGARPLEGGADRIVSPCDGAWGESGRIVDGRLLQVKGRRYGVGELLGDERTAARYEGGWFATFYLSPRDYHRFHVPLDGRFVRLDYEPGTLWPVNRVGLEGIDRLFARNERICAYLVPDPLVPDPLDPELAIALVAVGATMVGSVRLDFDEQTTNARGARPTRRDLGPRAPRYARGAEWGRFEFGSTIVMLLPAALGTLDCRPPGTPLRLGRAIGRYAGRPDEGAAPP